MKVTLWEYHGNDQEPVVVGQLTKPGNFEQSLIYTGWQHAANGAEGSRIYMRGDTNAVYEVH